MELPVLEEEFEGVLDDGDVLLVGPLLGSEGSRLGRDYPVLWFLGFLVVATTLYSLAVLCTCPGCSRKLSRSLNACLVGLFTVCLWCTTLCNRLTRGRRVTLVCYIM